MSLRGRLRLNVYIHEHMIGYIVMNEIFSIFLKASDIIGSIIAI